MMGRNWLNIIRINQDDYNAIIWVELDYGN